MDWDEEIKRQAAISALLAPPEDGQSPPLDTRTDEQVVAQPENKSDWHKLADQVFDTKTDEQVTPSSDYPAVQLPDKKYDTQVAESVVPYGEGEKPATPVSDYAPKDTGKGAAPEDYPTIAQDQGKGESSGQQAPDALTQVERATLVKLPPQVRRAELVDPDPDRNYFELNQADKSVPGFIEGSKNTILNPAAGVIKPDPTQGNFGDEELARSILAPDKPVPRAQPVAPRAAIVQDPIVARSIAKNIADQSAPPPVTTQLPNAPLTQTSPTPLPDAPLAQTSPTQLPNAPLALAPADQVIQPKTTDDWSKLADSIWPSVKSAITEAGNVGTLKAGAGDRVDPQELYSYLQNKFAGSPLIGYVPPDGARWGIKTGSAAEWAAFGLAVARQESGFNAKSYNPHDPGTSVGLFQFGPGQIQFTDGVDQFNPQASADAFVRSVEHYVNGGSVANMGETFGSIRRPNEAGQYIPWAQGVAGQAPAAAAAAEQPQSLEDLAKDWVKLSPDEQAAADAQGQANRTKILTDLQNKAPNLPAFMQALGNPIEGISDTDRNAKAAEIKKQLTVYAQDYYKEPNPDKAYARVMAAAANPAGTAAGELVSKLGPNFMHAWLSLKQQTDSPIQTRLIDFINTVQPDASPEDRTNLIKQVMSKTGKDRVDFVNHLYNAGLQTHPDTVKNVNMMSLLDSIDVASQPGMEAKMDQYHTWVQGMVAQNLKDLREDPSLEHTALGSVANAAPAMIKNIAEVAIPYIGQSAMLSEVYTDTLDGLRREHPELSEDQLKAMAASKSLPQAILQELVNAGTMGVGGSALKGVQNPIARIISSGIAHGVVGGTAGTAQQALSNVMTGRPAGEGLQEAGTTAFIQSFLGGAWGGRHGEAEAPPPGEPTPAVPLTQDTKLPRNVVGGGAETAVPSEPTPILTPNRAVRTSDVLGQEPGDQHVVSSTDVLGHQEDYTPQEPIPWFKQGVTPAERHDPLVIRGGERTAFTPQELSDIVNRLPSNATPAEVARVLDQVRSPTGVHLGEESTGEVQRAQAVQEQPGPVQFWKSDRQRTLAEQAWIKANAGEPVDNAIAKAKAAASLGGAPAAPTTPQAKPQAKQMRPGPPPPVNGNIGGEDPHIVRESNKTTVNGVANRYVAERVAGGELPPTDPNIGVTTEELLARGAKMGPDEINKHVSDLMEGKVNNPRDMAAAVRAKERELTQRSRQLGILSEENPGNAQAKLEADNALAKLHDFHSEGGPIKKMKEIFNHIGVGLQGDLQYDLSSENGLKEKFFQESKGKKAPPQADPAIKETAARVRRAYSEDYQAKKRVSAEVDKWLGKKMSDQQIEETRQAALKKMNMDPC